jgi:hypothetical protein
MVVPLGSEGRGENWLECRIKNKQINKLANQQINQKN